MEGIVEVAEKASPTAERRCKGLAGIAPATEASRGPRKAAGSALEERSDRAERVRGSFADQSSCAEWRECRAEWRNRPPAVTSGCLKSTSDYMKWSSGDMKRSIGDMKSSIGSAKAAVSRIVDRRSEIAGHPVARPGHLDPSSCRMMVGGGRLGFTTERYCGQPPHVLCAAWYVVRCICDREAGMIVVFERLSARLSPYRRLRVLPSFDHPFDNEFPMVRPSGPRCLYGGGPHDVRRCCALRRWHACLPALVLAAACGSEPPPRA